MPRFPPGKWGQHSFPVRSVVRVPELTAGPGLRSARKRRSLHRVSLLFGVLTSHFTAWWKIVAISQVFPTPSWASCRSSWFYMCPGVRVGPREVAGVSSTPTGKAHGGLGSGVRLGWRGGPNTHHVVTLAPGPSESELQTDQSEHPGVDLRAYLDLWPRAQAASWFPPAWARAVVVKLPGVRLPSQGPSAQPGPSHSPGGICPADSLACSLPPPPLHLLSLFLFLLPFFSLPPLPHFGKHQHL